MFQAETLPATLMEAAAHSPVCAASLPTATLKHAHVCGHSLMPVHMLGQGGTPRAIGPHGFTDCHPLTRSERVSHGHSHMPYTTAPLPEPLRAGFLQGECVKSEQRCLLREPRGLATGPARGRPRCFGGGVGRSRSPGAQKTSCCIRQGWGRDSPCANAPAPA